MDAKAQYIDIRWIIEVSIHAPVMDANAKTFNARLTVSFQSTRP